MYYVLEIGTLGSVQPARIVGGELSRIVTVNELCAQLLYKYIRIIPMNHKL